MKKLGLRFTNQCLSINRMPSVFCFVLLISLVILSSTSFSQENKNAKAEDYTTVVTQRSNKIVSQLGISDSSIFYQVQNILVQQYTNLNNVFNLYNEKVKVVKKDTVTPKATKEQLISDIENERMKKLSGFHADFIASLQKHLSVEQINKVKDGMTYNKLNVTYNAYVDMIPSLTKEQKEKIYNYLLEAREFAMDAGSSEKKTEWFGKYKGRINNYLSQQGYDMKKEEQGWQQRIKERQETNKKTS